ncbi:hypothetical protein B0A48_16013 [Cryoendolithus antarcticus]|uniref:WSC domain-containing protein n=1 Tax=Cryoendolithus antarcticus TaxID=1507870 RepID=A0A1V8SF15_9PEZI|nr:hypothetical protein B0A48_16013 [Cryoendolithus antarcticus]
MSSKMLITSLGLASLALHGSQAMRLPEKRQNTLTPYTTENWRSLGCFSDSQQDRTLSLQAHSGEHNDDGACQLQCQALGYAYAGTEYGGECWCDNYVNTDSVQKPDSDCNMACTKTATQPCGGADRINLFWNGTFIGNPPVKTTTVNPGVDGWVSQGCWTDSTAARTLTHPVGTTGGGSEMTIPLCLSACKNAGYTLAGAEYSGECYCDNTYANGAPTSDSTCSNKCNGDKLNFCGGAGAMNLYSLNGATPQKAASGPVTPVTPTLPSGWTSLGCWTDATNNRAFRNQVQQPAGGMTVDYCTATCSSQGYSYAGLEFGSECWCDNAVQNNQGQASDGSAGCNKPCSGSAGETCGGAGRLNVYAAGGAWRSLGCYADQPNARTLAVEKDYFGSLTPATCQAYCQTNGYPYSGMEYGRECHCGFSFENGGGPAPDGNAGCSFVCEGDNTELCGGSNRLSMFEYVNTDGTVSSKAPTTGTGSGSGTGTGTTTPAAGPSQVPSNLPSGWSFQSCYNDNPGNRILSKQQPNSDTMEIESCISACSGAGYSIAGMEYSHECYCDNALASYASIASSQSNCNMACSGDSTELCGGAGAISVFSTGTPASSSPSPVSSPTAASPTAQQVSSLNYYGCFSDSVGARRFPYQYQHPSGELNTLSTCFNGCYYAGYIYAGLEYGQYAV